MGIAGLFIIAFGGLGLTVLIGLVERFLFFKNQTAEEGEGEEVSLLHRESLRYLEVRERKTMVN
jgi:hypothetical protein